MSIFQPVSMKCPHCDEPLEFQASASVNADRRPDLRAAILDGSFQRGTCSRCSESFRAEPSLNYLDIGRGQWVAAFSADWVDRWSELEAGALNAFSQAFGAQATAPAQAIGETLKPRVVFGWLAFAEKLLAADAGLDDATLELTKLALIRGLDDPPRVAQQLRLVVCEGDSLGFLIVERDGSYHKDSEQLDVPRLLYDEVANDPAGWGGLRETISAGFFVDAARMTRGVGEDSVR